MKPTFLPFVSEILGQAAKVAAANFGRVAGTVKIGDNNQVLTETDLEIGKLIVGAVQEQYPGHNVIDEEAGVVDKHSDYTWVIDPIDGTSNFASGVPTYGILVGLLEGGRPIAGGIALPAFGEIYLGGDDSPATLNGSPIHVSAATSLLSSLVAWGIDGHQEKPELTRAEAAALGEMVLNIRNLRSSNSCFDAAMVARGAYGLSINQTSKIWDNVAQQAVIEASGGLYTDYSGKPLDYSSPISKSGTNFTWCFGAPILHEAAQRLLQQI